MKFASPGFTKEAVWYQPDLPHSKEALNQIAAARTVLDQIKIEKPDGTIDWGKWFLKIQRLNPPLVRESVLQGFGQTREEIIQALNDAGIDPEGGGLDPEQFPEIIEPEMAEICSPINRSSWARTFLANAGDSKDPSGPMPALFVALDTQSENSNAYLKSIHRFFDGLEKSSDNLAKYLLTDSLGLHHLDPRVLIVGTFLQLYPSKAWVREQEKSVQLKFNSPETMRTKELRALDRALGIAEKTGDMKTHAELSEKLARFREVFGAYYETKACQRTIKEYRRAMRKIVENHFG